MNLLQYIPKIYDKNLLLNIVCSEVNGPERSYNLIYGSIYMCVHCTKKPKWLIYKFLQKSIHCTGYPLIQVEIASHM